MSYFMNPIESKECFAGGHTKPLSEFDVTSKKHLLRNGFTHCLSCRECSKPDVKREFILSKYPAYTTRPETNRWYT